MKVNAHPCFVGLLAEMRHTGIAANHIKYGAAISACGKAHQWQGALGLLVEMRRADITVEGACEKGQQWHVALG